MPIFAYRCGSCGFEKDALQKRSDPPLVTCPQCNQDSFAKQLTAPAFQLKGSGWYVTDFRDKGKTAGKEAESSGAASGSGAPAKSGNEAPSASSGAADGAPSTSGGSSGSAQSSGSKATASSGAGAGPAPTAASSGSSGSSGSSAGAA